MIRKLVMLAITSFVAKKLMARTQQTQRSPFPTRANH